MKQILTIISLFCCIGMSAQDITPLDKIFDEMSAITKGPRNDVKQKINHGNGVVMYVHNHPVGKYYHCSKECGSSIPGEDMTVEDIKDIFNENDIMNITSNNLTDLLIELGTAKSKREAREFISGNAVKINGEKVTEEAYEITDKDLIGNKYIIIKRGKKNFYVGKKN